MIDHINIVVQNLSLQLEFYRDKLGFTVSKEATISGDWIEAIVGLKNVVGDVIYLTLDEGPRLELIYYHSPQGLKLDGLDLANTFGLRHIAFQVEDIDSLVKRLKKQGVDFFSEVQDVPQTQVTYKGGKRKRLVYFKDPEGTLLEFSEYT